MAFFKFIFVHFQSPAFSGDPLPKRGQISTNEEAATATPNVVIPSVPQTDTSSSPPSTPFTSATQPPASSTKFKSIAHTFLITNFQCQKIIMKNMEFLSLRLCKPFFCTASAFKYLTLTLCFYGCGLFSPLFSCRHRQLFYFCHPFHEQIHNLIVIQADGWIHRQVIHRFEKLFF